MCEAVIRPSETETALDLHYYMKVSRAFEEKLWECYQKGMIHGTMHLAVGEEGTAAGTCRALTTRDRIYTTHRGHCHAICKGVDVKKMMAEMLARDTGTSRGRGGSMHMIDPKVGVMGANGIVGPTPALACGSAFAIVRHHEPDAIAAAFFGDGATSEGAVHEAMNLASVWNLPVLFVLENNGYGMSTPLARATRDTDLAKRAVPYGIPVMDVDGNDVMAVYRTVLKAREQILKSGRPMLVVEHTYRISGHSKSDKNWYRSAEEIAEWQAKDPIVHLENQLIRQQLATKETLQAAAIRAVDVVEEAVHWAQKQPLPEVEEACADVYAKGENLNDR